MAGDQVLQRSADQEGLLLEAQLATGLGAVVRIEHPVQASAATRWRLAATWSPRQKVAKSIGATLPGLPLAQGGDALAVVRRHDEVVGLRHHHLAARPAPAAGRPGWKASHHAAAEAHG
jgi:hypothetical protein